MSDETSPASLARSAGETETEADAEADAEVEEPGDGAEAEAEAEAEAGAVAPVETGAQAVVAALERAGAEYLFGVQGGAIMPVYDALYDSGLEHVTMAHEQGAAHAADAYGIVSGEPGICIATSGPGATNLVTGIADADMDSDPLVALTGQVPTDLVGNDAFQETDTMGVTGPITKANTFAEDPDRVGADVGEAYALAAAGRPGPTLVDLPKDVTQGETDRAPDEPETPSTYEVPEAADPGTVRAAARAIEAARKPVLLLGGGVIKGEATEECREFAFEHEIPVVTTMPALGAFPEDHELALEMAGMHGTGYANMAITHCDLLIAVGTRFDDRLTGNIATFAPEAEVIHADIDPAEVSKNVHADYPLIGDAAAVVEQLSAAVERSPQTKKWCAQCQQWKSEYPMTYDVPSGANSDDSPTSGRSSGTPAEEPLKPQFVVEAFDEATDEDAIVTTGVGQHQMWAVQYWTFTEPRTWVSSHGLGAMGYGLPAAIGARLAAEDDRAVICFDGDGSFLMTQQELAVAVREELDITVAVLNNEAIGMVCQWQDGFYEGRRMASEYPWVPAFDELAEAYGARGYSVAGYEEVGPAVEGALAYDGPAVIDFHVDPRERVFPMVPSGSDNGRFALTEGHLDQL